MIKEFYQTKRQTFGTIMLVSSIQRAESVISNFLTNGLITPILYYRDVSTPRNTYTIPPITSRKLSCVNWWWQCDKLALIIESPRDAHYDAKSRLLHNLKGPALVFRDKTEEHYLAGMRLPKKLWESGFCDVARVYLGAKGAREKLCMIASFGVEKFVKALDIKPERKWGGLVVYHIPGPECLYVDAKRLWLISKLSGEQVGGFVKR